MISPIIKYIADMQAQGKKITQEHIKRYLDTMKKAGKNVRKNRIGGICNCGKPYKKKSIDNNIGKWTWYVRTCDCDD